MWHRCWLCIGLCALFLTLLSPVGARVPSDILLLQDSLRRLPQDSLKRLSPDSLRHKALSDSLLRVQLRDSSYVDSLRLQSVDSLFHEDHEDHEGHAHAHTDSTYGEASIDAPVFGVAKDSAYEIFSEGQKIMRYYGDVQVTYGQMELKAAFMEYNMDTRIVFAKGVPDSTGALQGKPEMKDGNSTYTMDSVYYNFDSGKSLIFHMRTQEADGYLHGARIKKIGDSYNIANGKYTTCDAEEPHFHLHLTMAKMVEKPGKKIMFGPAWMVLEDVPLPLALPFGFVPDRPDRSGGLLMPSYGEEITRGFFLKGLGYYFVLGEYLDFSVTGDIYSLGSWNMTATSRYKKMYGFSGDLNVNISENIAGERGSSDFVQSRDFRLSWSHTQDPKARPGTNFNARVEFSSPSNNRFNSQSTQQALQNQTSSSISYAKTFVGTPFNMSLNLLHSQNSLDSSYALTLPNFTLTMSRIFPFKRKERVGKEQFYEKISFSYNTNFDNKLNFKASDFTNGENLLSKSKNGMKHGFSIGLPTFSLLKYLQFAPSISYGMNWYFQKKEKRFDPITEKVEDYWTDPFRSFGVTQEVSGGISMSTRVYGTFNFNKRNKESTLQTIRHMVTPSVSFSFKPDMAIPMNGYTSLAYTDSLGKDYLVEYNIYEGSMFGPPIRGKTANMSFSLGNNIEAKVRSKTDTTNGGIKKMKLIDNLSLSGSYNFLADSMKLSPISVSLSTTLMQNLSVSANATLNPYAVNARGTTISTFNMVKEGIPFRITNASLSFSYQFNGGSGSNSSSGGGQGGSSAPNAYQRMYQHPVTGEYIPGGWVYYMAPNIPWSVGLNYNYSYSLSYQYTNEQLLKNNNHSQTMGVNAQLRLTSALNMSLNTGVDMMKMSLTTTQFSASYDLHCFVISVSWVPSGRWQSWSFRINAKASALADLLKYDKRSSYWDN